MLSEQSDGCLFVCKQACRGDVHHVEPMPHPDSQLIITMEGVQFASTIDVIGLSVIQVTITSCSLWESKRGGATFTVGVNVLSVIQN